MKKYPLQLSYTAKSAIWGGELLRNEWGKKGDGANIAETWELSVRPKEMATILNGEANGMTLGDWFDTVGYDAVSPTYSKGDRFPLLIKFIDANDTLSVQVHPDDSYASRVENDSGKTEMWYIVDAKDGASIIYGLADGVSSADLAAAVANKTLDTAMRKCPVKAGETYFIPAGMLHAIGAGILIAEIQQNSDLTYRVYDYERRQADGSLRELHTEKALDVIRPYSEEEIDAIRFEKGGSEADGLLANSKYFKVVRKDVDGVEKMIRDSESFSFLLCVNGNGNIIFDGEKYPISRGEGYFIPAGMGEYIVDGDISLICSEL